MDFGKKGDAKKAMKLMWKEGITLKQAWKKVKSGKKSRSSKRRGSESPKKKRAQKQAKKAMKLHWKEGITLKQAWKKVKKNKFGDAVCPQGYEPNPNFTGEGASRRRPCLKKCDMFFMRDPTTGRCRKMTMASQGGPPVPGGYEIGPSGRKRKICPPGSYRDPTTGRCRKIRTQLQPLIAPAPGSVAAPFGGSTLMDFGGRYSKEMKNCGTHFGETVFNLPVVRSRQAPHYPARGRGVQWRQKLWFGENKKCGFGSCKTCNMKF